VSADIAARIRAAIERDLAPAEVLVDDESALHAGHAGSREGGHFRVHVVSERFRGLTRVARHRLIYQAVAALMGRGVHALAVNARAPDEEDEEITSTY
jgi:BolA family transcriptional regulator, general stress-responsive regulator